MLVNERFESCRVGIHIRRNKIIRCAYSTVQEKICALKLKL